MIYLGANTNAFVAGWYILQTTSTSGAGVLLLVLGRQLLEAAANKAAGNLSSPSDLFKGQESVRPCAFLTYHLGILIIHIRKRYIYIYYIVSYRITLVCSRYLLHHKVFVEDLCLIFGGGFCNKFQEWYFDVSQIWLKWGKEKPRQGNTRKKTRLFQTVAGKWPGPHKIRN